MPQRLQHRLQGLGMPAFKHQMSQHDQLRHDPSAPEFEAHFVVCARHAHQHFGACCH
jgi:hypothetical protein